MTNKLKFIIYNMIFLLYFLIRLRGIDDILIDIFNFFKFFYI